MNYVALRKPNSDSIVRVGPHTASLLIAAGWVAAGEVEIPLPFDPFPLYVTDEELEAALADIGAGPGGGGLTESQIAALVRGTGTLGTSVQDVAVDAVTDEVADGDSDLRAALLSLFGGGSGLTPEQADKLAGIALGATKNDTDAALRARASHTGQQTAATISDFATAVQQVPGFGQGSGDGLTTEQANKIASVETGATKNAADAALRDRATHTGTQELATVTGLTDALNGKLPIPAGGTVGNVLTKGSSGTYVWGAAATGGGSSNLLVLGANDVVPADTPVGTLILRSAS